MANEITTDNIFGDLGFEKEESENLKIRAEFMQALVGFINNSKMTQVDAAEFFGVSQPRISNLMKGKINLFTIDTLLNMLVHANFKVDFKLEYGKAA